LDNDVIKILDVEEPELTADEVDELTGELEAEG